RNTQVVRPFPGWRRRKRNRIRLANNRVGKAHRSPIQSRSNRKHCQCSRGGQQLGRRRIGSGSVPYHVALNKGLRLPRKIKPANNDLPTFAERKENGGAAICQQRSLCSELPSVIHCTANHGVAIRCNSRDASSNLLGDIYPRLVQHKRPSAKLWSWIGTLRERRPFSKQDRCPNPVRKRPAQRFGLSIESQMQTEH